jgi:hypothetical protein
VHAGRPIGKFDDWNAGLSTERTIR